MNKERMMENWLNEMIDYYELEAFEAMSIEEMNDTLVEVNLNAELTPEWLGLYLDAMQEYYASVFETAYTFDNYSEDLRRVFMTQETVVEMPFTSKHALEAAMNY